MTRVKNTDTLRERAAKRAPPAKDEIAEKFEREKKANAEYAEFGFISFPSFQTAEAYVFVRNPHVYETSIVNGAAGRSLCAA